MGYQVGAQYTGEGHALCPLLVEYCSLRKVDQKIFMVAFLEQFNPNTPFPIYGPVLLGFSFTPIIHKRLISVFKEVCTGI